jgi:putative phosphoesterase
LIVIVSDTHGDSQSWKAIDKGFLKEAKLVLHAGDVLYHGPRNQLPAGYAPEELSRRLRELSIPILFAQGNCDSQVDEMVLELPLAGEYLVTIINGVKVLLHHGHQLNPERVRDLCRRWSIDLCIQGHTHIPSLVKEAGTVYLNPGSPSLPKGEVPQGTIAIWHDNLIQLIEWKTGHVLEELELCL